MQRVWVKHPIPLHYLCPAVVYLAAGLGGVGVEEGRQLLLRMPEVMEHVP